MALQSIGGVVIAPDYPAYETSLPSFLATVVDADAEGYGIVFQAPATGTITGIGTMTGTLTAGDANTLFQLESVLLTGTPGIPNGIIAANRSGIVDVAASNTYYEATLTAGYAATQGELIAATVNRQAGGSLNTQFNLFADDSNNSPGGAQMAYAVVKVGASWTSGLSGAPMWAINYGGTYYMIRGSWPFSAAFTSNTFSNASTPDVIGNIWIPRFKCRVKGVWLLIDLDGAVAVKFYDTDGVTVLAEATLAANSRPSNGPGLYFVPFSDAAGEVTVSPTVGSTYRIGVEPSSATNVTTYTFTANSAAIMDAFGFGQNMYLTSAKDPTGTGDWTNTTTQRTFLGVMIDQLDDGVGGGGGGSLIESLVVA